MSSEWIESTLGDICRDQHGSIQTGPFGSQLHTSDYTDEGTPIVMPTNIGGQGISQEGIARIGQEDVKRLSQHQLKVGDIVFSRRGDVTKNALIREAESGWLCGTGCLKVRIGSERIASAQFISYYLRLPEIKDWLVRHAVGATMPNLNTGILAAVPVILPPLEAQHRITKFLGALDDRITLLRETNKTLESIAQAIFKSWFVDFDAVRAKMEGRQPEGMDEATAALFPDSFEESELGLIPSSWRHQTMADVSVVGIGKTPPRKERHWFTTDPKDMKWLSIRDMAGPDVYTSRTSEFLTREAIDKFRVRVVPDNTVLMSFKMTVGRLAITCGPMTTNEAIAHFKLDAAPPVSSEYIYLALKNFDFTTLSSTSSIVDAVNSKTVQKIPILVPSEPVALEFKGRIKAIFERIRNIQQLTESLETIRDSLLPRLISGNIELSSLEAHSDA